METKRIKLGLIVAVMLIMVCSKDVFAAALWDHLPEPEAGWRRYDDSDSRITYQNIGNKTSTDYYNGTLHSVVPEKTSNTSIKFNFTGNKLRFINLLNDKTFADDIKVIIDGETYTYMQGTGEHINAYQMISFEKLDLKDGEHCVEIIPEDDKFFNFDAIDIDDNGELKEYNNEINTTILDIEADKKQIAVNETIIADLTIDNITSIVAEDIFIKYDNEKLEFIGFEEVEGFKLVKSVNATENGELRVITASLGESNIVNLKEILLQLKFRGIKAGEAIIDITSGRVTDGITIEKDLIDVNCDQETIVITGPQDVNFSGEFTLLDLGIDALHFGKDPKLPEFSQYNLDIVKNDAVDENDLIEIANQMLANPNYLVK